MRQTSFMDSNSGDVSECPHFFPGQTGPTIKILLYTDDPVDVTDDPVRDWSLGVMLQHIQAHAPAFANLCFKLVSRNSTLTTHADMRIDDLVKNGKFDQIWFFGIHQGNRTNFSMEVLRGGPHSELEPDEVAALANWMKVGEGEGQIGGGVLVTGDHAEPRPPDAEPPASGAGVDEFWGLGRALGVHIPRAGRMRRWQGPPSRRVTDSQNTQVLSVGTDLEEVLLQFDPNPQRLILQLFDEQGTPGMRGRPHPIFFYRQGTFIQIYPDHTHEGRVIVPSSTDLADASVWPNSNIVKPEVVARGIDSRRPEIVDLVAAYNGDRAGVGRIVADSTWHHYFNVNLNRFLPPGDVNSFTDQIGQFYANLTLWLTPLPKRREMANAMIGWLANHPAFFEERVLEDLSEEELGAVFMHQGDKAQQLLSQVASPCEIHELVSTLIPDDVGQLVHVSDRGFEFRSYGSTEYLLPSRELLLGSFINLYHRKVARAESSGDSAGLLEGAVHDVAAEGFNRALKTQNAYLKRLFSASQNWFK